MLAHPDKGDIGMSEGRIHIVYAGGRRLRAALVTVTVAVVGVFAAAGTAGAASPATRADTALNHALARLVNLPGGPPGVLAVIERGRRRAVVSHGVADLRTRRRIEMGDHWRI